MNWFVGHTFQDDWTFAIDVLLERRKQWPPTLTVTVAGEQPTEGKEKGMDRREKKREGAGTANGDSDTYGSEWYNVELPVEPYYANELRDPTHIFLFSNTGAIDYLKNEKR